jgi:hypothetical protein
MAPFPPMGFAASADGSDSREMVLCRGGSGTGWYRIMRPYFSPLVYRKSTWLAGLDLCTALHLRLVWCRKYSLNFKILCLLPVEYAPTMQNLKELYWNVSLVPSLPGILSPSDLADESWRSGRDFSTSSSCTIESGARSFGGWRHSMRVGVRRSSHNSMTQVPRLMVVSSSKSDHGERHSSTAWFNIVRRINIL